MPESGELRLRKTNQAQTHGFGDTDWCVRAGQHFNLAVDLKAVLLNRLIGEAKFGRQVHAGSNNL
jgi:hypothetical protein